MVNWAMVQLRPWHCQDQAAPASAVTCAAPPFGRARSQRWRAQIVWRSWWRISKMHCTRTDRDCGNSSPRCWSRRWPHCALIPGTFRPVPTSVRRTIHLVPKQQQNLRLECSQYMVYMHMLRDSAMFTNMNRTHLHHRNFQHPPADHHLAEKKKQQKCVAIINRYMCKCTYVCMSW